MREGRPGKFLFLLRNWPLRGRQKICSQRAHVRALGARVAALKEMWRPLRGRGGQPRRSLNPARRHRRPLPPARRRGSRGPNRGSPLGATWVGRAQGCIGVRDGWAVDSEAASSEEHSDPPCDPNLRAPRGSRHQPHTKHETQAPTCDPGPPHAQIRHLEPSSRRKSPRQKKGQNSTPARLHREAHRRRMRRKREEEARRRREPPEEKSKRRDDTNAKRKAKRGKAAERGRQGETIERQTKHGRRGGGRGGRWEDGGGRDEKDRHFRTPHAGMFTSTHARPDMHRAGSCRSCATLKTQHQP